jgi:GTP-binding protein
MIIGENSKEMDIEINPTREKHLNNIRVKGHEEQIRLIPPKIFTIEEAISYVR